MVRSSAYRVSLQEKIDALQRELDALKAEKEWYDTSDPLTLSNGEKRIEIESQYGTWCQTKYETITDDILLLDIYDGEFSDVTASTSITLEQMIQLRDYLTHKIEYLQS